MKNKTSFNLITLIKFIGALFVVTISYKIYSKFFGKSEIPPDQQLSDGEKKTISAISAIHVDEAQLSISQTNAQQVADDYFKEVNSVIYFDLSYAQSLFASLKIK